MAEKKVYEGTFEDIIKMTKEEFIQHLVDFGNQEAFKKIAKRKVEHKKYHRIQKPMKFDAKKPDKFNPEKMTWQKDTTRPPITVKEQITFMEAKAAYCYEVLKMPKPVKKEKEPTWLDDIANL